jgi:hypothetical protein
MWMMFPKVMSMDSDKVEMTNRFEESARTNKSRQKYIKSGGNKQRCSENHFTTTKGRSFSIVFSPIPFT